MSSQSQTPGFTDKQKADLQEFFRQAEEDYPRFEAGLKATFKEHFKTPYEAMTDAQKEQVAMAWKIYRAGAADGLGIAVSLAEARFAKAAGLN